jgi:site-specific DNA recombinase
MTGTLAPEEPRQDEPAPLKRAVIYLRVSTAKQADKAEDAEGYSLPAQREACLRKAHDLGAEVVGEYLDRGESAKTTDRPEFQRMLARVREAHDVDYVILDKIDRFARNRRDDANTLFELQSYGAKLVSVKENIDETPAGQLLHAIMAGIAEFYSRNLATEAIKGMTQKARSGGTPGRAPIGYLNTRRRIDGREIRVVVVDPDRARLVQWAFEAYATGQYTIRSLTAELVARGLTALPHGKRPVGPVQPSHVHHLLRNRYYLGYVTFKGAEYVGQHQPLIAQTLFDSVQTILKAHDASGEKTRVHPHYLKGSIFCGQCGSRLCYTLAKGQYPYFYCLGRHQRRTTCTQKYLPVEAVEAAIERHYATVRFTQELADTIQTGLKAEMDNQTARARPELTMAARRVTELEAERKRLARGVVTGAIPGDLAREEHERIDQELEQARRILSTSELIYANIEGTLTVAVDLLTRVDEVYRLGGPKTRRLTNQCFFRKLLISDTDSDSPRVVSSVLNEPWATLLQREFQDRMAHNTTNPDHDLSGRGSEMMTLVPPAGDVTDLHGPLSCTVAVTCSYALPAVTTRCPADDRVQGNG